MQMDHVVWQNDIVNNKYMVVYTTLNQFLTLIKSKKEEYIMKTIFISTYCHWTSFGSMLQSLGLQRALKDINADGKTITFSEEEDIPVIKKANFGLNRSTINYLYQILNKERLECGQRRCFKFMVDNIQRVCISDRDNIHSELPIADIYIAGSDQIWHPALNRDDFFLCYAPKNKKKISYAASMGIIDIPQQKQERFNLLLQNIDSYSVREEEMVSVIKKYTDKPVYQHIDPTFLVDATSWRKYEKSYNINKPYILVYALYWDRSFNKQLKDLHKKTEYQIISIQNTIRPIYSNKTIMDIGPAEFLWLIDHAEAIVTSSFHGTAFSIIFNKRFYPVVNPSAPSRINSLLRTLKVAIPSTLEKIMDYNTNYDFVNLNIKKEKNRGLEYLRSEIYNEE